MPQKETLNTLVNSLLKNVKGNPTIEDHIWYAIRGALQPFLLVNNLAESLRITTRETEELLTKNGFGDIVMQAQIEETKKEEFSLNSSKKSFAKISDTSTLKSPFQKLFSIIATPSLDHPIPLSSKRARAYSELVKHVLLTIGSDPFADLYRANVKQYYTNFMKTDAKKIDAYIKKHFGKSGLKYIVNSGIGANEQFNHFVAYINNKNEKRKHDWLIINSPRQLSKLPPDATIENTLFMEFSRSGKTEETIKIHEYTPVEARRIVFANAGPLRDIGKRDGNLLLQLPDQVSGRFGRNTTPTLLAPMYAAGMDTEKFWGYIEKSINAFNLTDPNNLPFQIAKFIYLYQMVNGINHIYIGCNEDSLIMLADELTQFWNEGVSKRKNDILMSRYLGLPRDSHTNVEGILANCDTKMAIFLFTDTVVPPALHPLIRKDIQPINAAHSGLTYGDEEIFLAEANYERFSERMPCIKITVHGSPSLHHAAVISQLWADITFCYSRLKGIDPGSNPEVKYVRDRSAQLLAKGAAKLRKQ